jgi:hypothetical protein
MELAVANVGEPIIESELAVVTDLEICNSKGGELVHA